MVVEETHPFALRLEEEETGETEQVGADTREQERGANLGVRKLQTECTCTCTCGERTDDTPSTHQAHMDDTSSSLAAHSAAHVAHPAASLHCCSPALDTL